MTASVNTDGVRAPLALRDMQAPKRLRELANAVEPYGLPFAGGARRLKPVALKWRGIATMTVGGTHVLDEIHLPKTRGLIIVTSLIHHWTSLS
jgi:hypothetical protein